MNDLTDRLFAIAVFMPIGVIAAVIGMIITWPLKQLRILDWDYWDFFCYLGDEKDLSSTITEDGIWSKEEFYKVKYIKPFGYGYLDLILGLIPKFSGDVYLTVDENPIELGFEVVMTPGTIKTNLWAWHIHKDKILCELKQKRAEIKEQKMMEDF